METAAAPHSACYGALVEARAPYEHWLLAHEAVEALALSPSPLQDRLCEACTRLLRLGLKPNLEPRFRKRLEEILSYTRSDTVPHSGIQHFTKVMSDDTALELAGKIWKLYAAMSDSYQDD